MQAANISTLAVAILDLLLPGYHHFAFLRRLGQTAVGGIHQPTPLRDGNLHFQTIAEQRAALTHHWRVETFFGIHGSFVALAGCGVGRPAPLVAVNGLAGP